MADARHYYNEIDLDAAQRQGDGAMSVMRVNPIRLNSRIEGVPNRHASRHNDVELPSHANRAHQLNAESIGRITSPVRAVRLQAIPSLVKTLNQELCHA